MIIVMLGKLRSGKSEAAGHIISGIESLYNVELIRKPLAAPIYAEAKALYEKHGLIWRKNRRLLEGIGEALNEDYPNGDKIVELYDKTFNPEQNIIIEDCRRLTQAEYLKDKGALFFRINALDNIRKSRCKPGEWAEGHVTDNELDTYEADFIIQNNSTLDDLISQITQALNSRLLIEKVSNPFS